MLYFIEQNTTGRGQYSSEHINTSVVVTSDQRVVHQGELK